MGQPLLAERLPIYSYPALLDSVLTAMAVVHTYQGSGFRAAVDQISRIVPRQTAYALSLSQLTAPEIRPVAARIDRVTQVRFGRQRCLLHAIATCAGLRRLGIDATVVVGHQMVEGGRWPSPIHAWVSVDEAPVSVPASVRSYYFEIGRYPQPSSATSR